MCEFHNTNSETLSVHILQYVGMLTGISSGWFGFTAYIFGNVACRTARFTKFCFLLVAMVINSMVQDC